MIQKKSRKISNGQRGGPAPYGYELSHECDGNGRRFLVPLAYEQEVLRTIESMRADGLKLRKIARRLNEAKIPARRDGTWRATRISIVLQRSGKRAGP